MIARLSLVPLLISIHALCEEGDMHDLQLRPKAWISIHALCEEGD